MLKKLVIVAAIGFVAVAAVKSTKIGSYIRSEMNALREEAEANIPPEKEIGRLRNEIKLLDKDLMTVVNQLAKERVEVTQLKEKADDLRGKQSVDKELLQNRAEAIKKATDKTTEQVVFGDRKLSIAAAKAELETGVRRYTANQKSLDSMDATVANREKVKESLEKQLETLKNQKTDLAAAVDGLEADLTNLKLQQMESKYQTDDSRLAKIKEDIRALRTKMDIEREKLKLLPSTLEPSATPYSSKSVDDIMAPLNAPAKTATGEPKKPVVE
jgi:chromosome segregation ATPase